MERCSNNHNEVCYEGRVCPVCDLRSELAAEINNLEHTINDLENDIRELEDL